jgi:plastocyanin
MVSVHREIGRNSKDRTMRITFLSAIFIVILAGILGCGSDSNNPAAPKPSREHFKRVQMQDNVFSPVDLVISVGDTVQWENAGSNPHTSTSGAGCAADGLWNSGTLSSGQKFMAIFDAGHINQTGTLPYFCTFHCVLNMKGTITVNP